MACATARREVSGFMALLSLAAFAPGCPLTPSQSTTAAALQQGATAPSAATTASAAAASTVIAGTPRAAKIIFKQAFPNGSFDAASAAGTRAQPGKGHPATRVFNPDGSMLSGTGPGSATWPAWLSSFEIGISGGNNASAPASNCAKFADATESTATNCDLKGAVGAGTDHCGAPGSLYRVSEFDCKSGTTTVDGNGGPSDGVYIRATFDRAQLGTAENMMAVIEYVAASFNPAPESPVDCFNGGVFTPENCSDVAWKVFLKHNVTEMVQPFLMLAPPTQNFVVTANSVTGLTSSGANPSTKQIYVPLAADPSLSVFQVSRIRSALNASSAAVMAACNNLPAPGAAVLPANTPLCAGIVFYSLTFYRI